MDENHILGYYPETIITFQKAKGQYYRLESIVSYECLTMIPVRALVLRILA